MSFLSTSFIRMRSVVTGASEVLELAFNDLLGSTAFDRVGPWDSALVLLIELAKKIS